MRFVFIPVFQLFLEDVSQCLEEETLSENGRSKTVRVLKLGLYIREELDLPKWKIFQNPMSPLVLLAGYLDQECIATKYAFCIHTFI